MKRIISIIIAVTMVFSFSACSFKKDDIKERKSAEPRINYEDNLRAVWLSYYEIGDIFSSLNENEAKEKLDEMFSFLSERGINTVFFHTRAFCDAFYFSDYFPLSSYSPKGYDLLKLAVSLAHKKRMSIHAWINPYRVALNKTISDVSENSPAIKLYNENKENLISGEGFVFLNPASINAQKLILDGIREIVENYDIDGIHFDDYFYPSQSVSLDKQLYASYKKSGGTLSLEDYRRENVSALISSVKTLIKGENKNIIFGISPQASIEKNKSELFADVLEWINEGYVDYIMPQVYFGFKNETSPFEETVLNWKELLKNKNVSLYCGLAKYKEGKTDEYASADKQSETSPFFEWVNDEKIIERQIDFLNANGIKGYSIYSYSDLLREN